MKKPKLFSADVERSLKSSFRFYSASPESASYQMISLYKNGKKKILFEKLLKGQTAKNLEKKEKKKETNMGQK